MRADASGAAAADTVTSAVEEFAADVRTYFALSPRQLPSRYLYDALGSALFDAICRLPWYRVTRAESGLLERHAAEIVSAMAPLARVVELGGGNGEKLAILVAARRALDAAPLQVHLVDVSRAALDSAARAVAAVDVEVVTHQARFMRWLEQTADADDRPNGRTLSLFLGSNIGNFDRPAADQLLRLMRATLRPGDGFLLGADLVKSEADLQLAYDDPLGLTAAFNRNLIVRLNRELDARIDLAGFQHRAVWNAVESRVEMHLVSTRAQTVDIPRAGVHVTMEAGEFIWTESSYKYVPADLTRTLERCGFRARGQWIDCDAGFALTLVDVA